MGGELRTRADGQRQYCVTVMVVNDLEVEPEEEFIIEFTDDSSFMGDVETCRVKIAGEELSAELFQCVQSQYTFAEGSNGEVCITISSMIDSSELDVIAVDSSAEGTS